MARYKPANYVQSKLIPVSFEEQILPGSFEHTLNRLIDNEISCRHFDRQYKNDATGATVYNPCVLLKIILYTYSKGIPSSRGMAWACRTNVQFMVLSVYCQPHFTTIADFISAIFDQITRLYPTVFLVYDEIRLFGKEIFPIDAHWSLRIEEMGTLKTGK